MATSGLEVSFSGTRKHGAEHGLEFGRLSLKKGEAGFANPAALRYEAEPEAAFVEFLEDDSECLAEVGSAYGFVGFCEVGADGGAASNQLINHATGAAATLELLGHIYDAMAEGVDSFDRG